MRDFIVAIAVLCGVAVGWAQFRLLKKILFDRRYWLVAVKLLVWAIPMVGAVLLSTGALLGFTIGASVTYLAIGMIQWRRMCKGD